MRALNQRLPAAMIAILACLAAATGRAAVPADAEVRAMLARRVDVQQQAVGIVVAIVTPAGTRYVHYGSVAVGDARAPDRHTVFEIASVGKVFTALLLADLATRGELAVDDPVSRYLPPALVTVPRYGDRDITLFDLASHTAGLPLRPPNLGSQTQLDKYASYTVEQLYRGISEFRLERAPGSAFEYSNVGYGLLGNALGHHTGRSYEAMVLERIARPLGLTETREALTPPMRRREAVGHLPDLTPGIFEGAGALEGAGSLHSTAADLARLLRCFMGLRASPLRAAMTSMTARLRPADEPATQVGLGWRVTTLDGHAIVWSNGRADGFRSFIGYSTATRVGVVALANVGSDAGADDIAEHLIDPYFPVNLQGPDDHREIALPEAALARFAGRYQFDDHRVMTIRQDGLLLVAELSGQRGAFALHAEAPSGFFLREADAQATFEGADGAPAELLVWHQNGHHDRARRIP
jgi:D-alanyl-D-alanine-carboxypeptidase/D-alanyl-D-alanine-endopeptidase